MNNISCFVSGHSFIGFEDDFGNAVKKCTRCPYIVTIISEKKGIYYTP
jgi:hypothetical protein